MLVGANAFQLVSGNVLTNEKNVEPHDMPEGSQPGSELSLPAHNLMNINDNEDTSPSDVPSARERRFYDYPTPTANTDPMNTGINGTATNEL